MENKTVQYVFGQCPYEKTKSDKSNNRNNSKRKNEYGFVKTIKNNRDKNEKWYGKMDVRKRFKIIIPEHSNRFVFIGNKILRHDFNNPNAKVKFSD
jgi:hypothetical protein